ncbi:MAG: hypothetical protein ABFR02_10640 [Campylobacterota bacterium]
MKHLFTIILAVTFSLLAHADSSSATFNQAGFSINTFDAKASNAGSQPLTMMLPASNGFSANVNVQIQPFPGSLNDYKNLSEAQFVQMGLKTISSSENGNELYWEYAGNIQGKNMHFFAKAIKVGNLFYLATGTDLESNWPKTSKKIKSVITSFVTQ